MPQSEEAQWWFDAVYRTVQQIPPGKCTSYGHIALLLGYPKRPRQVGVCLKHLPNFDSAEPERHYFHSDNVPWQRVVNAKGGISPRGDGGVAAAKQVERLRAEGVVVNDPRGVEEPWVDLGTWGWFPKHLPGEASEEEEEENEETVQLSPGGYVEEAAKQMQDLTRFVHVFLPDTGYVSELQVKYPFAGYTFTRDTSLWNHWEMTLVDMWT